MLLIHPKKTTGAGDSWQIERGHHSMLQAKEISVLTIQSQHGGKVLAVGDAGGVGHTRLPQVGPEGGRGDDGPVHGGDLPVVRRQRGRHQDPAGDGQEEGDDLCGHVAHSCCGPVQTGTGRTGGLSLRSDREQVGGSVPKRLDFASPFLHLWSPTSTPEDQCSSHSLKHNHLLYIGVCVCWWEGCAQRSSLRTACTGSARGSAAGGSL